ncbi:MAG: hypothetical protein JWM35_478 [Verrucomicrobia bacterium]|nr:hypothetical protein [Verrucomicrobiota bacterium]
MRSLARVFFIWLCVAITSPAQDSVYGSVRILLKYGDDPRYAEPGWDDRDWQVISPVDFPREAGVFWVRFHLIRPVQPTMRAPTETYYNYTWPSDEPGAPIDAVQFNPIFAFEFYWDGRLLERSGVVGTDRSSEAPGPLDHMFRIPDALRGPGEHVVAVRLSSFHYAFPWNPQLAFRLDNYADRLVYETRRPFLPLVGAGGSLILAIVCLLMARVVERRRPLIWCGVLGVLLSLFYGLVAMRWVYNTPYSWHYPRLELIILAMTGVAALVPWVLAEHFDLPQRRRWLIAFAPALVTIFLLQVSHESRAFWLSRAMLAAAGAIAVWAITKRKRGAWLVLLASGTSLLIVGRDGRTLGSSELFMVVSGLMIFVLAAVREQVRAEQQRAREAALAAARLEIELLKKNIQPHFLMNTLTTIMEVIEHEPKAAVGLIDALAGEFRILARVSGEKLIPLAQELELCRAHIRIMGLRRGVECSLDVSEVDESSPIPPALFHTLVEGGLTHQLPREGRLRFTLDAAYQPGLARYTMTVHGENPPASGPIRDGTGLRYVKARLEESFAGKWSLTAGPVAEGWRTVIEIRNPPGESGST